MQCTCTVGCKSALELVKSVSNAQQWTIAPREMIIIIILVHGVPDQISSSCTIPWGLFRIDYASFPPTSLEELAMARRDAAGLVGGFRAGTELRPEQPFQFQVTATATLTRAGFLMTHDPMLVGRLGLSACPPFLASPRHRYRRRK